MINYTNYFEEHRNELMQQIYELGYTPHDLVQEALKDNMNWKEYIVILCT